MEKTIANLREKPREELEPIAFHEAGHGVLALDKGLNIDMLDIKKYYSDGEYNCVFPKTIIYDMVPENTISETEVARAEMDLKDVGPGYFIIHTRRCIQPVIAGPLCQARAMQVPRPAKGWYQALSTDQGLCQELNAECDIESLNDYAGRIGVSKELVGMYMDYQFAEVELILQKQDFWERVEKVAEALLSGIGFLMEGDIISATYGGKIPQWHKQ